MDRISHILQKLDQMYHNDQAKTRIDIDLMLDYTRVLYADLHERLLQLPQQEMRMPEPEQTEDTNHSTPESEPVSAVSSHEEETPAPTAVADVPVGVPEATVADSDEDETEQVVEELERDTKGINYEPPASIHHAAPEATQVWVEEAPEPPAPTPEIIPLSVPDLPAAPTPRPAAIQGFTLPKDIRKTIGINDKYLYLNELFNNHKSNYEETLDRLSGLDTYKQAEEWLWSGVARDNKWDKEEATVQDFFTTLQKFFASR